MPTKKVTCPHCDHEFDVKTRADIGEGTQRKLEGLNNNKLTLLTIAYFNKFFRSTMINSVEASVNGFKKDLDHFKLKRWNRNDEDEPKGEWNYHNIQADLSLLVGNDWLSMSVGEEMFDGQSFTVDPIPVYFLNGFQLEKVRKIVNHNMRFRKIVRIMQTSDWMAFLP